MDCSEDLDSLLIEACQTGLYQATLRSLLTPLSPQHRIAFAASCAEQAFSFFQSLMNSISPDAVQILRKVIDRIWQHVLGRTLYHFEMIQFLGPHGSLRFDDDNTTWHSAIAQAVSAIQSALLACQGDSINRAIEAGVFSITIVMQVLLQIEKANTTVQEGFREIYSRLVHNPLLVTELRKQARVIRFLVEHIELTEHDIGEVREMATH